MFEEANAMKDRIRPRANECIGKELGFMIKA